MQLLAGVLSVLHGLRKSKGDDAKEQPKMEVPSKDAIMNVYENLRHTVYGYVYVTPSSAAAIEFLRANGLVEVRSEFFMDAHKGMVEKKTARWVGGWHCSNCTEYFVADLKTKPSLAADEVVLKNEPQCRHGFDMHFIDVNKGRRCPHYRDKRLLSLLGGEE
jgi:hypothetical protein